MASSIETIGEKGVETSTQTSSDKEEEEEVVDISKLKPRQTVHFGDPEAPAFIKTQDETIAYEIVKNVMELAINSTNSVVFEFDRSHLGSIAITMTDNIKQDTQYIVCGVGDVPIASLPAINGVCRHNPIPGNQLCIPRVDLDERTKDSAYVKGGLRSYVGVRLKTLPECNICVLWVHKPSDDDSLKKASTFLEYLGAKVDNFLSLCIQDHKNQQEAMAIKNQHIIDDEKKKTRDNFLRYIFHEIRVPLNVLVMNLDELKEIYNDEGKKKSLMKHSNNRRKNTHTCYSIDDDHDDDNGNIIHSSKINDFSHNSNDDDDDDDDDDDNFIHNSKSKDFSYKRGENDKRNDGEHNTFLDSKSGSYTHENNGKFKFNDDDNKNSLLSQDVEKAEIIGSMDQSVDGILTVINDMLDLSSIEAGKFKLFFHKEDINTVLMRSFRALIIPAKKKGLALRLNLDPMLEPCCFDVKRMIQMFNNLILNAIKFTNEGEIIVTTKYKAQQEQVEITVEDTGIGIHPGMLPKLFQPYCQGSVNRGSLQKFGGSGLGLYLCRTIITGHRGTVTCSSQVDKGTTFTICFPYNLDEDFCASAVVSNEDFCKSAAAVVSTDDLFFNETTLDPKRKLSVQQAKELDTKNSPLDSNNSSNSNSNTGTFLFDDSNNSNYSDSNSISNSNRNRNSNSNSNSNNKNNKNNNNNSSSDSDSNNGGNDYDNIKRKSQSNNSAKRIKMSSSKDSNDCQHATNDEKDMNLFRSDSGSCYDYDHTRRKDNYKKSKIIVGFKSSIHNDCKENGDGPPEGLSGNKHQDDKIEGNEDEAGTDVLSDHDIDNDDKGKKLTIKSKKKRKKRNENRQEERSTPLEVDASVKAKLKILIVDDSPPSRIILHKYLQREGYHCDESVDGNRAVEKCLLKQRENQIYDVIFMDMEMPLLDGLQATKIIRIISPKSVIIGLTGNGLPTDIQALSNAGADWVIMKPFSKQQKLDFARRIKEMFPSNVEKA